VTQDVHTLAGAYALDALDDVERHLFERHLASCATCSAEVEEFLLTTSRLGAAVAEPPPPAMRERVLAAVDTTRQRQPLPARAATRAPRLRRFAAPLAAAAVAAVLAFVAASVLDGGEAAPQPSDVLAEVLAEPEAETVALDSTGEFMGSVVTAPTAPRALVTLSGLREQPGEVYVVWTEREGALVREGELSAQADGEATTLVLEGAGTVSGVAVSREPPGGGAAPAGPIVAQVTLD